ncbi:MAG: DNA-protecting protein DprA [Desulfobulbus propionicus]|nr:MAG: DNA-protecting protein DprA [Desulfobulbus propionicus]
MISHFGSPEHVFAAAGAMLEVPGVGPSLRKRFQDQAVLAAAQKRADRELEQLQQRNISFLSISSAYYPKLLKNIPEPPVVLYCKGDLALLDKPGVAVVGSRSATDYGKRVSTMLAQELSCQGLSIISGGAYGIDAAAHEGALQGEGTTCAVLGCGIDVVYPKVHQQLFQAIEQDGLLLSEYPLGAKPEPFRFPARNRIISGLATGVVVVEATLKSGSLITARLALDQGREVFAVPGRIDSIKSSGCHRLIQQGAHLVNNAEDIIHELGFVTTGRLTREQGENTVSAPHLENEEETLLSFIDIYPVDIDTLLRLSGLNSNIIHSLLLQLELKGLIRQLPGQQYEKVT